MTRIPRKIQNRRIRFVNKTHYDRNLNRHIHVWYASIDLSTRNWTRQFVGKGPTKLAAYSDMKERMKSFSQWLKDYHQRNISNNRAA